MSQANIVMTGALILMITTTWWRMFTAHRCAPYRGPRTMLFIALLLPWCSVVLLRAVTVAAASASTWGPSPDQAPPAGRPDRHLAPLARLEPAALVVG